jgi:hypothetical protein
MMARKTRLRTYGVGLALLVLACLFSHLAIRDRYPPPEASRSIGFGMTEEHVEQILGGPPEFRDANYLRTGTFNVPITRITVPAGYVAHWQTNAGFIIQVHFGADRSVAKVGVYLAGEPRGALQVFFEDTVEPCLR